METYRQGDFVQIINTAKCQIDRTVGKDVNVFEIKEIEVEFVKLIDCFGRIPLREIQPIPINGKDDLKIYYSPYVMATIVESGDPTPFHSVDYSYYMDSLESSFYQGKSIKALINERNLKYVHEVQHYLFDELNCKGLKINIIF